MDSAAGSPVVGIDAAGIGPAPVDLRLLGIMVGRLLRRVERVERQLSKDVDDVADQVIAMRRRLNEVAFELCAIDGVSDQVCEEFEALRRTVDALRSAILGDSRETIDQPVRRGATRRAVARGR